MPRRRGARRRPMRPCKQMATGHGLGSRNPRELGPAEGTAASRVGRRSFRQADWRVLADQHTVWAWKETRATTTCGSAALFF
jgi:hypothetical protein